MNICIIGKHQIQPRLTDNSLNAPIILHHAKTFDRVFLIYRSPDGVKHHATHENIETYLLPGRSGPLGAPLFVIRAFIICRRIHREFGVAVVSASEPFGGGVAGVLLKHFIGVPFVFQIQGQLLNLPTGSYSMTRRWLVRAATRLVAGRADLVRCVSNEVKRAAIRSGIPDRKLRVVGYRLDLERFAPARSEAVRMALRAQLGLSPDDFTLLYLGALLRDKGVYDLVEALRLLSSSHPSARLVVVGGGPERAGLEREAASAGLKDKVVFVGQVEHQEVPRYLAVADVFVLPSKPEGWGRVISEAMVMSLPVIASNVGGTTELITSGENGLVLETDTAEEISAAVAGLIEDPKLRRRLGVRAREHAEREWPFDKMADKLVSIYVDAVRDANR